MYFTIENPDIKLMEELEYSKRVAEKSKSETINTLNNIKNELDEPLNQIVNFNDKKIITSTKEELIKEVYKNKDEDPKEINEQYTILLENLFDYRNKAILEKNEDILKEMLDKNYTVAYLKDNNLKNITNNIKKHHEIYLSDPRRTASNKLRTILRIPVQK